MAEVYSAQLQRKVNPFLTFIFHSCQFGVELIFVNRNFVIVVLTVVLFYSIQVVAGTVSLTHHAHII